MRYTVSEKQGIIEMVVRSEIGVNRTLKSIGLSGIILEHYSDLASGRHYYTDTIDYFTISGDLTQTTEFYLPDQFYLDSSNGKFKISVQGLMTGYSK